MEALSMTKPLAPPSSLVRGELAGAASTAAPAPLPMSEDELGAKMKALAEAEGKQARAPRAKQNKGKGQKYLFTRDSLAAMAEAGMTRKEAAAAIGAGTNYGTVARAAHKWKIRFKPERET